MNYELLRIDRIIYILSIAFQVAGAVLLIIKYWGRTEERIIAEYFPKVAFASVNTFGKITMEKDKIQECARKIYHNRMSFIYIAIGYTLSIWGNITDVCKLCVLAHTVVCTILLIGIEYLIVWTVSIVVYRKNIDKDYAELKNTVPADVIEF